MTSPRRRYPTDLTAEADAHIRNGTSSPRLLLELLIARLAGAGAPAATTR